MRISLRREHLIAWIVLSIGLIVLVTLAWVSNDARDHPVTDAKDTSTSINATIQDQNGIPTLQLDVPHMPVAPSIYVFVSEDRWTKPGASDPVGLVDKVGRHRFMLRDEINDWSTAYVSLVDVVRDSILVQIKMDR